MTTATRLIPDGQPDKQGRQRYKPVKATVTGFSKYNPDEFSLSGVDGFWNLVPDLMEKYGRPKEGAVAVWTLTTKPKSGPMAKPGSVYRDVVALGKVTDYVEPEPDEPDLDSFQPSLQDRVSEAQKHEPKPHPDAITPNDPLPAEWTLPLREYRHKNESIQAQTIFNGIVEILTSDSAHFDVDEIEQLKANLFGLIDRLAPGLPIALAGEPASGEDIDGPAEPAA